MTIITIWINKMFFEIELKSGTTVYQQIIDKVKSDIAKGALAPGDRLPTIRDLAARIRINRNTVSKAYQELEREGLIYTRPGGGSFVANSSSDLKKRERIRILEKMAHDLAVEGYHFQIEKSELMNILTKQIELLEKGRKS